MFDDMQELAITGLTKIALVIVALVLLVEAASIAFVTLRVAAGVKEVASIPWPAMPAMRDWSVSSVLGVLWRDLLQLLKPFLPQHSILHHPESLRQWIGAAWRTLVWLALIAQAFFMRYFLVEYAGDVAAYISPFKDSKFDSIRTEIQADWAERCQRLSMGSTGSTVFRTISGSWWLATRWGRCWRTTRSTRSSTWILRPRSRVASGRWSGQPTWCTFGLAAGQGNVSVSKPVEPCG